MSNWNRASNKSRWGTPQLFPPTLQASGPKYPYKDYSLDRCATAVRSVPTLKMYGISGENSQSLKIGSLEEMEAMEERLEMREMLEMQEMREM
jgi:hypothetical protein